jgi:hypothetical protein
MPMMTLVNVCLRADGSREEVTPGLPVGKVAALIGAETLDSVNLRDGRVMFVDDAGHAKRLPANLQATALYHAICLPGTTWPILGDVVIVRDADY